jgi:hypothetical protein
LAGYPLTLGINPHSAGNLEKKFLL